MTVGYSGHDWEIGNPSEFFLEIAIPREHVDHLAHLIASDRVQRLVIGMEGTGFLVDDYHAPPSVPVNWFLRPRDEDGRVDFPESVHGSLRALTITQKKVTVRGIHPDDEDDLPDVEEDEEIARDVAPAARQAGERHVVALEVIAKTLKMMPWIIGGGAAVIALALV